MRVRMRVGFRNHPAADDFGTYRVPSVPSPPDPFPAEHMTFEQNVPYPFIRQRGPPGRAERPTLSRRNAPATPPRSARRRWRQHRLSGGRASSNDRIRVLRNGSRMVKHVRCPILSHFDREEGAFA